MENKKIDWNIWINMSSLDVLEIAYLLANREPLSWGRFCEEDDQEPVKRFCDMIRRAVEDGELSFVEGPDFKTERIYTGDFVHWLVKKGCKFSLPQEVWEEFKKTADK